MKKIHVEALKFLVVGGANFFLTLAIFSASLRLLHLNYVIALGFAWLVGMFFSYVCNFAWVFKPEEKVRFNASFVRFFSAHLLSVVLNMLALSLIVETQGFDPFWTQICLIPFIVVFNFTAAKYWSLR